jgi:translation initiation factor IF-3
MFRGREVTHPERGAAILDRLAEELAELGVVEQRPLQEGKNMTMMMAPSKAVLAGRAGGSGASNGESPDGTPGDVASATLEPSSESNANPPGGASVPPTQAGADPPASASVS